MHFSLNTTVHPLIFFFFVAVVISSSFVVAIVCVRARVRVCVRVCVCVCSNKKKNPNLYIILKRNKKSILDRVSAKNMSTKPEKRGA